MCKSVRLGPLSYALAPHDAWGEEAVSAIDRHFPLALADAAAADRIIHLKRLPEDGADTAAGEFPEQLTRTILPEDLVGLTWQRHCNDLNTVWHSKLTRHALWTAPAGDGIGALRFHLPWDLVLHDLAKLGGGVIHAGVAVRSQRAWLFLAPPGGGKSTTMATAPSDWRVVSDDAALVWPEADGGWKVSPLLSWSAMMSPAELPCARVASMTETFRVSGLFALVKAPEVQFRTLSPIAAAAQLYCALTQYPAIFFCDHLHHEPFFRTACRLARQAPCWQLELPLGGDIWPGVADLERECR